MVVGVWILGYLKIVQSKVFPFNFNHCRDSNESFTLIRAILFFFYNQICFHAFVEKHFTFHDENFLKKVIDDQSSLFNKKPIILQFDSNNRREI